MRQIGTLPDEDQARRLSDYLLTRGISSRILKDPGGTSVWVHDEDRVPEARGEFDAFTKAPDDPRYAGSAPAARALRKKAEQVRKEHERQSIDLRNRWADQGFRRFPLTCSLIAASVVAFAAQWLGPELGIDPRQYFFIATGQGLHLEDLERWEPALVGAHWAGLVEVRSGEIWRLITPIFMHGGPIHLLFNMSMLYQLGRQIEAIRGSRRLVGLVLVSALASNLVQYFWAGPFFLGMSGVVYALFGYTWMKTIYEPNTLFRLGVNTVPIMLIWLVLCMTGAFGRIGNAAHFAGLAAGMFVGLLPNLLGSPRP